MSVKALVIGASSFSGRFMCEELLNAGYQVIGTSLDPGGEKETSGMIWEKMDLLDPESIRTVLEDYSPDCIFNFATQSSVGKAWTAPDECVRVNINGVLNLFEAIRSCGFDPKVVLVGAGEEYGRVDFDRLPIPETQNPHPSNVYAATMACQTMITRIYHKAYKLNLIVARTFNVLGPGQADYFAVSDFCRQAASIAQGKSPRELHVGNINIRRDFTDIRDMVRAYRLIAEQGQAGEIYNVGSGEEISIREILSCLIKRLGGDVKLVVDQERIRPVDIPDLVGDIFKLRKDTGWEPQIKLEQTLDDMLSYWTER